MASIDDTIAELEAKLKQAKAKKQLVEARKRTIEQKRKRSQNTRRKILAGAMLLEWMGKDAEVQRQMLDRIDGFLTREDDRSLFGLAGGSNALVEKATG